MPGFYPRAGGAGGDSWGVAGPEASSRLKNSGQQIAVQRALPPCHACNNCSVRTPPGREVLPAVPPGPGREPTCPTWAPGMGRLTQAALQLAQQVLPCRVTAWGSLRSQQVGGGGARGLSAAPRPGCMRRALAAGSCLVGSL